MNVKTQKSNKSTLSHRLARFRLSPQDKITLEKILADPPAYIPNPRFQRPKVMARLMACEIKGEVGKPLTREQEQTLFLQLNYARYKMAQIRRKLLRQTRWQKSILLELLQWYHSFLESRGRIITANIGLVLAMAQRSSYSDVEFADLISEGSMALLRTAEKFDCARGYKFSTYTCRAIFNGFHRAATLNQRYRSRFPVQWEEALERDDHIERLRKNERNDWLEEIRTVLDNNCAELTRKEKFVLKMRFSLNETLQEVGDELGLCKERIRQIQNRAIAKLREAVR